MSGIVGSSHNIRGSGIVAKLGTDGQVFTSSGAGLSQTFEDAAGGGSWNLIKTQTITSTTATMDFVDGTSSVVFDSTYKMYVCILTDFRPVNDGVNLELVISLDTGSSYQSSGYEAGEHGTYWASGVGEGEYTKFVTDAMMANQANGNATTELGATTIWMPNPSDSGGYPYTYHQTICTKDNSNYIRPGNGGGRYNTATAYDAFRLQYSSGNILEGIGSLYGIST